jgi:spore coat polysaccharide biosynthesis protein SpsF
MLGAGIVCEHRSIESTERMLRKFDMAAVVVARTDSARFPGKVLADVGGISLVEFIFSRLTRVRSLGGIVLSTTARPCDDRLAEYFASAGGAVFRCPPGQLDDVASRFVAAADSVGAEYALRVNGDSPFPSAELILEGTAMITEQTDLVTNLLPRTYPYGISVEWIRVDSLRTALFQLDAHHLEHFTQFFYEQSDRFNICSLPPLDPPLANLQLTVDEPSDLDRVRQIVAALGGVESATKAQLPEIMDTLTAMKSPQVDAPPLP